MFLARTEQLGLATPPTQFTAAQQASGPRPVAINQKNTTQESTNWQFFLRGRKMDWSLFALSSLSHQNALALKYPHDVSSRSAATAPSSTHSVLTSTVLVSGSCHRTQPQYRPPRNKCPFRLASVSGSVVHSSSVGAAAASPTCTTLFLPSYNPKPDTPPLRAACPPLSTGRVLKNTCICCCAKGREPPFCHPAAGC